MVRLLLYKRQKWEEGSGRMGGSGVVVMERCTVDGGNLGCGCGGGHFLCPPAPGCHLYLQRIQRLREVSDLLPTAPRNTDCAKFTKTKANNGRGC